MKKLSILLLPFIFLLSTCLLPPPEEPLEPWMPLGVKTETNIRNAHANASELLLIADTEFLRFNTQNNLVERRRLNIPFRFFGRPILSDFTFARVVRTSEQFREIEFHLVKNKDEIFRINEEEMVSETGESILIQPNARNAGAFNQNGTKLLIPATRVPGNYYTFFIFDIQLNSTNTAFESIEIDQRIDIPEFPSDPANLSNVKFVNGNYYVTSLDGAYRISPEGEYLKISPNWKFDVFEKDGTLYMTGFEDFDFYISNDNGITWHISNDAAKVQMVEKVNNKIVTHQTLGFPFKLPTADFKEAPDMFLNEEFPLDNTAYTNIVYFHKNYYLTVLRETYFSCRIFPVEE